MDCLGYNNFSCRNIVYNNNHDNSIRQFLNPYTLYPLTKRRKNSTQLTILLDVALDSEDIFSATDALGFPIEVLFAITSLLFPKTLLSSCALPIP